MKITKKVFAAVAAVVLGISAFAQEFSFENEVSTDVVYLDGFSDENDFAGFAEKAAFEFNSEKVDIGLTLKFLLGPAHLVGAGDSDNIAFNWKYEDFDYYIAFRPFNILTLGLHNDVYMDGAYLPVFDDNIDIAPANLGSTGFSVFVQPIEGLRIAATIPFDIGDPNFLNGKNDLVDEYGNPYDEPNPFDIGFGVDYTNDLFSVGAKVSDVIDSDEIGFGVYGSFMPMKSEDLVIRAGFAHGEGGIAREKLDYNEYVAIGGKNLYNVSVAFSADALSLAAEVFGNTDKDEYQTLLPDDMYIGACVGYGINDSLEIGLTGKLFLDFSDDGAKPLIDLNPSVTYKTGSHTLSAGVDVELCDGDTVICFPLAWKYSF